MTRLILLQVLLVIRYVIAASNKTFPDGFMFGVSTAAYQIEGAWNEDSKGESIWDRYVHQIPSVIDDNATGDVTCDSYHKYKEDVKLLADMGLSHYRFSLSWTRILPTGFDNDINYAGIRYYKNLLSELAKYNITPVVTIYHWDLPQSIEDLGGWLNPKIVDYFADYVRVVFQNLGHLADYWITINEPKQVCTSGYGQGSIAPGIAHSGQGDYICAYHVLKAHAAGYHMYKNMNFGGKITLSIDGSWSQPISSQQADIDAADRRFQFEFGLYANPVFKGNWPQIVIDRVAERSKKENFTRSRLPAFTKDDIKDILGTADFMSLNFYEARLVSDVKEGDYDSTSLLKDMKTNATKDPSWPLSTNGNTIVPLAFRLFLKWIKTNYDDPNIFITENGVGDDGTSLYDTTRIYYISDYLSSMLEAIQEDKVKVFGYTHWSLMDNFEWRHGFRPHFGLYSVNFTDPNRTRTAKASVDFYRQIATTLSIPDITTTTTLSTDSTETPTKPSETSTEAPSSSKQTEKSTEASTEHSEPTEPGTTHLPTSTKKPGGGANSLNINIYCLLTSLMIFMYSIA